METVNKSTLTDKLIAYKSNEQSRKFWEEYLATNIDQVHFSDYLETGTVESVISEHHYECSQETTKLVSKVCRNMKSFQVFMNAGIALLVYKLTAKTDLKIGNKVETPLNDVLPLRVALDPKMAFSSFISTLAKGYQAAAGHANYPVTLLQEQKYGEQHKLLDIGVLFNEQTPFEDQQADILFRFRFSPEEERLKCSISLDQSNYSPAFATLLFNSLEQILTNGLADVKVPVQTIGMLTDKQEAQINTALNTTTVPYPSDSSVIAEFERTATEFPDKIALTGGNAQLTYSELSHKVNILASQLQAAGVQANSRVAVLTGMSTEFIITIMAVLKAGGCYVPLSVVNPHSRTLELLEDIDPQLIIVGNEKDEQIRTVLDAVTRKIFAFDQVDFEVEVPVSQYEAGELAYIMFTSGSTGKPKGVQIPQKAILRLVKNTNFVTLDEHTKILLTGAATFDATTFEIWGALLNGGSLYLAEEKQLLDSTEFRKLLDVYMINTLWLTSPLFNQLVDQSSENLFATVKYLVVGGDVLSPKHIHQVRSQNPGITVVNGYGPTENTTFSVTTEVNDGNKENIPLGKPINNSTAYVLDHDLKMVPSGVWGILYVGGDGLATGYLNKPALTEQKFIANPYGEGKLYKTDDIVRLENDLAITFKGRNDNQVKIRGFRIETGEIEHHLKTHPLVNNCIVKPDGQGAAKMLVAYFTAAEKVTQEELKQHLATKVADYMVPAIYYQMDKFPLTANGKIDQKLLPKPILQNDQSANERLSETEKQLAGLWSEILGVPISELEADSDFFALGGHSLSAMSLLSRIHQQFNVKVSIEKLYTASTLKTLGTLLSNSSSSEKLVDIPKADSTKEYFQVSSAQKRMFVLQQLSPESVAYNITTHSVLPVAMDLGKMKKCLYQLVERHESFRTSFIRQSGTVWQSIADEVQMTIEEFAGTKEECHSFIKGFTRPFDLTSEPLVRLAIVHPAGGPYILSIDMHHIIADGVSQELFLREFNTLYQGGTLPAQSEITYKDYAEWQQTEQYQKSLAGDKDFWHAQLQEDIPDLGLALDHPRPAVRGFEGGMLSFEIEGQQLSDLRHIMDRTGVSMSNIMMALWSVTVSRFAKSRKLIVGLPVSGRSHHQLNQVVGMFVNMLPIVCDIDAAETFEVYLEKVKKSIAAGLNHQNYQYEDLLDDLNVPRDTSRNPLFDVSLNVLKAATTWEEYQQEAAGNDLFERQGVAKFDLTLNVLEFDKGCTFEIDYAKELFKETTIQKIKRAFLQLLTMVSENSANTLLGEVSLLSDQELDQVTEKFNDYRLSYALTPVTEQVKHHSQSDEGTTAVIDRKGALSYRSFYQMSEVVARNLQTLGVTKGEVVGLSMTSSKEVAVAMNGIMMAGGLFLPFDPELPAERVKNMLTQANVQYVISEEKNDDLEAITHLLPIDAMIDGSQLKEEASSLPLPQISMSDGAYVIFTSGTTGVPNGVTVSHGALLNLCAWHCDYYQVTRSDRASKYASLSFDATVWEIFPYLYQGASLYFSDPADKYELKTLNEKFEEHGVTIAFLPTQMGEKFTELTNRSLKSLLLGGDKLKQVSFDNDYQIYNNYGPTENAVVATAGEVLEGSDRITIGKPIANCEILILYPEFDQLTPINVIGEICIAGHSLADGYINNQELTDRSFIPHPFRAGERMYRTGDLGKWLPSGEIAFEGRDNDQVSIRGFRIELGEIEHQIAQLSEVKEVAVLCRNADGDNPQLCGYYTTEEALTDEELKRYLIGKVPSYMVPAHIMKLEEMPLNTSGKIDKSRLPEPELKAAAFELPANEIEEKLIAIWADLLGMQVSEISTRQNFFEIGGNSMKVLNLKDRIFEELRVDIPVVSLFEYTTIQALATHFTEREKEEAAELERLEEQERDSLEVLDETLQNLNFE
ncbi:MAG: amino acid adenylation domain-containing protein [Bacteroidota bacterium]